MRLRLPKRPHHHRSGFTLIELLISIAILAGMTALVWGSFSISAKSKQRVEKMGERYHQIRVAMNRMVREISMAYLSKNDTLGTTNPRTRFVSLRNRTIDDFMFSAMAHNPFEENAKECDQSLIRYFQAPDPDDRSRTNLMRRESRRLGVEHPGEEGQAEIVLEDVTELHYEFLDDTLNEWKEDWNTTTADGQPDRLPAVVRISGVIKDERGKDMPILTAARLQLRDPLWFSN